MASSDPFAATPITKRGAPYKERLQGIVHFPKRNCSLPECLGNLCLPTELVEKQMATFALQDAAN